MLNVFSHSLFFASSTKDVIGIVFWAFIVLSIFFVVIYLKGCKAGYDQRKKDDNNHLEIYKKRIEEIDKKNEKLKNHLKALSVFSANSSLYFFSLDLYKSKRNTYEEMKLDALSKYAIHLIDTIEKDIANNDFSLSLNEFNKQFQEKQKKYEEDIRSYNDKLIEIEKEKIRINDEFKKAKKQMMEEFGDSVQTSIKTAIESNPNNAYIATTLTSIEESVIKRINVYIKNEYKYRAPQTATKTIAAIEKKFNERAKQWRFDSIYYKNQTALYESLFPQLLEYSTLEDLEAEFIAKEKTSESDWLTEEEYISLSRLEKSQHAFNNYVKSDKSKWQIGRDYELFIGYLYRKDGWYVEHFGIEKKLEDLGRDLICRRKIKHESDFAEILVVQCKFWSSQKVIHEKHIAQLFGTTVEYAISLGYPYVNKSGRITKHITPVFVTSSSLSTTAKSFANALGVKIIENKTFNPKDIEEFPRIKCNMGRDGEKIYHLPFDQQYDTTKIDSSNKNECWAFTIQEAEEKGYRRAMKWSGVE